MTTGATFKLPGNFFAAVSLFLTLAGIFWIVAVDNTNTKARLDRIGSQISELKVDIAALGLARQQGQAAGGDAIVRLGIVENDVVNLGSHLSVIKQSIDRLQTTVDSLKDRMWPPPPDEP